MKKNSNAAGLLGKLPKTALIRTAKLFGMINSTKGEETAQGEDLPRYLDPGREEKRMISVYSLRSSMVNSLEGSSVHKENNEIKNVIT
jgi:hypothetical protein